MKNLTIHNMYKHKIHCFENIKNNEKVKKVKCTINPNNNDLYMLLSNDLYVITTKYEKPVTRQFKIAQQENIKIISLEYCTTLQELYCAYETGKIIKIKISESSFEHNEVRHFETGLKCMKFSPDYEIITIVTGTGILLTMGLDFHTIKQVDLYSLDFTQILVDIGWGKKETQFHGSAGKAAAKTKKQLNTNLSDDDCIRISWREDSLLFAVSFQAPETKIRSIKIFDKGGDLISFSEDTNGLNSCLAWRPLINVITTSMKIDDKCYITFFEKNGLKLKDYEIFSLAEEVKILDLFWSSNSEILAAVAMSSTTNLMSLQLWTECNSHLYLKQTFNFASEPLLYWTWATTDINNKDNLILVLRNEILVYSFRWCINRSRGKTENDLAVVCVIDGHKLRITAFRKGIIPPPLAHQVIHVDTAINAIAFAPDIHNEKSVINSNMFCVILCNNVLLIFKPKPNVFKMEYELYKRYNTFHDCVGFNLETSFYDTSYVFNHFLWHEENFILCTMCAENIDCGFLFSIYLRDINSREDSLLEVQTSAVLTGPVEHLFSNSEHNGIYLIIGDNVFLYHGRRLTLLSMKLRETYREIDIIEIQDESRLIKHCVFIALTFNNCLLVNGQEYSKSVLSYFICNDFILCTTSRQELIYIPLKTMSEIKEVNKENIEIKDLINKFNKFIQPMQDIRRIEKDAYIITTISEGSKAILQLPRGNLECIEPTMLIIRMLKVLLNNCQYMKATNFIQKHHIDFNLIYDHDPELFTKNAEQFINDIDLKFLSLFLFTLKIEDTTKTIYKKCYTDRSPESENKKIEVNKLIHVSNLLRNIMEKRQDADELIQPILLSLVKSGQKEGLQIALIKLKELLKSEKSNISKYSSRLSADNALKYLLKEIDLNILYNIALSIYDLELAMFIASKSQSDPKEYISFLNTLKVMDENYMKYTIDMRLKNYESALIHIAKNLDQFDKCLNLICSQKLYKPALKLFKRDTTEYKRIAASFAEHLMQEKHYNKASIMFHRCNDLDKALEALMLASNWEDIIITLRKMKLSPIDLRKHYQTAVKYLKTNGKYDDAAIVLLHYLKDAEEAVAILCKGRSWKHAMRIAYDIERSDLIETHIKPGIKEHTDFLLSHLKDTKENFLRYKSRLALLRSRMSVREGLIFSEMVSCSKYLPTCNEITDSDSTIADTFSVTSSEISGKSDRPYKNRKKQEKKLLSLKEGSTFEDFGLINALYHIIANTYKNIDEWIQFLQILLYFEFDEIALKLQNEINDFLRLTQDSKSEIWDRSAPCSIDELRGKSTYTLPQIFKMTAPLKSLEKFIIFPPETNASYLDIV